MTCPACGMTNPDGFRFCGSCGAALTAPETQARSERKVVTVLFADLVGFTSQAEALDPEDVRAILDGYHSRLRAELERHGGTVEKFIGDAVMALFGAPVAHEDDPERAVRAALAIRDSLADDRAAGGRELHARIGITTGEALVHLGARPESGEGMAAGDVVNTAARLQSAAPVDGIVVDESTYGATERRIDFEAAEPVEAKGKAEPVAVWTVVGARSSFGADVAETARAGLVGREQEVAVLREALARVRRDGQPQLVTLVGVPGIGKSRLVFELSRIVDEDPDLIVWRQGRCLPYGEGGSVRALGDIVKAQAGILETDGEAEALAKLREAVAALVPEEAEAAWLERQLGPLAGLSGTADASEQEGAFTAWRRFVEALAEERPAVIVLEDLHWADDLLLDFVEHLADWAVGVPLLVVCVTRPELLSRRPSWGGGNPNSTTLSLSPLGDPDIARLVAGLMDRAVMPADVQAALLVRAGGNPLYAEEFVRLVLDSGERAVDADSLPSSVQAIIAARLDGLEAADKALVQDAAVIGKVFWRGGIGALSGRSPDDVERRLHELVRRQIVRPDRRSSVAGESEYAFWHVLVRDVAYGQIPRAERARKHQRAAEWIASLAPDRIADRADLLAHHYMTALELARAAGGDTQALVAPAREALRAAGVRSFALHSFTAAERSLRAALELWPDDDPERAMVLLEYARAAYVLESGREELRTARDALVAAGDLEHAAEAETLLGEAAWMAGEPAETLEHVRHAASLLAGRPASREKAYVAANLSRYLMLAGRSTEAVATGREALAMAEALGLDDLRAHALNNIGSARGALGDLDGRADLEESIAIAERVGSPEAIRGYINLAVSYGSRGEVRQCREIHQRGYDLAERFGFRTRVRFLAGELANDDYFLGDWKRSLAGCDAFISDVEAGAPHYLEGLVRLTRASIDSARGGSDRTGTDLRLALEGARHGGEPQTILPALAVAAHVAVDAGDASGAAVLADELLGVASSLEDGPYVQLWIYPGLHAFEELGRGPEVEALLVDAPASALIDAARRHVAGDLVAAADVLGRAGVLPDEARTRLAAAERFGAAGRRAEAHAQLDLALDFYRSVGASLYVRRAEQLLAASA